MYAINANHSHGFELNVVRPNGLANSEHSKHWLHSE